MGRMTSVVPKNSRSAKFAKKCVNYKKRWTTSAEKKADGKAPVNARAQRFYPTDDVSRRFKTTAQKTNRAVPKLKEGLEAGSVLILVAGRHRGKRVVFLKQLDSGLLLVTGPFKINGVPLRRCTQSAVIATSTKLDVSGVKVPDNINDAYFKRAAPTKKNEEGIFEQKQEKYTASEQRKADQKAVDAGLLKAVGADAFMKGYLQKDFGLSRGQYPHLMKF